MHTIAQALLMISSGVAKPFTLTFDTVTPTPIVADPVNNSYLASYGIVFSGFYFANFAYTDGTIGTAVPNSDYTLPFFAHYIGAGGCSIALPASLQCRKIILYRQQGGGWSDTYITTNLGGPYLVTESGSSEFTWQLHTYDLDTLSGTYPVLASGYITEINWTNPFGVMAIDNVTIY